MIRKTPLDSWILEKVAGGKSGQGLTREILHRYQLEKLRKTIDYARARSPFYRRRFEGLSSNGITSLADLGSFPLTVADDVRENPFRFLCVSPGKIERAVTLQTSGTRGEPKRLFFTANDLELTVDFFVTVCPRLWRPAKKCSYCCPVTGRIASAIFWRERSSAWVSKE